MLKKRSFAVLICIVAVLLSTWVSVRSGLDEIVDDVNEAFIEGNDGSGYSIYTDLQSRAGLARNFVVVAARYMDADGPLLRELSRAAEKLEGETDPGKAYDANTALDEAVAAVNAELMTMELSDTDESYRIGILVDLESYNSTIEHDDYNLLVEEARREMSKFPANIFRLITFVGNAEYYQ